VRSTAANQCRCASSGNGMADCGAQQCWTVRNV